MADQTLSPTLPRDTPDYHRRQASHFRALAESATTPALKARLLEEAEKHERMARGETYIRVAGLPDH
jgi:hypothetical protein